MRKAIVAGVCNQIYFNRTVEIIGKFDLNNFTNLKQYLEKELNESRETIVIFSVIFLED